jgi:hypothetical protein
MTTNAYIFSWDITGVEAIVPISEYEDWDTTQAFAALSGKTKKPSPLNEIVGRLTMRARFNPQRFYEIYAIDCDATFTPSVWSELWHDNPQMCADMIREKGVKIYGDRMPAETVRIR